MNATKDKAEIRRHGWSVPQADPRPQLHRIRPRSPVLRAGVRDVGWNAGGVGTRAGYGVRSRSLPSAAQQAEGCPTSTAVPNPCGPPGGAKAEGRGEEELRVRPWEAQGKAQPGGGPVRSRSLTFCSSSGCSVQALSHLSGTSSLEGEEVLGKDGPVGQRPVSCPRGF